MKNTSEAKKSSPTAKTPKKPRKITQDYLENAGKFYLEKFPASAGHFRTVMTRKIRKSCMGHPDQDPSACAELLEAVIEKFIRLGFLNDEAFAKGLLYSYRQRGWSQRKIRATLAQKGLPEEIVGEQMDAQSAEESSDLTAALRMIRRKRLGAFATSDAKADKWLAALARAGFDYGTAQKALSMDKEEAEDILRSAEA